MYDSEQAKLGGVSTEIIVLGGTVNVFAVVILVELVASRHILHLWC